MLLEIPLITMMKKEKIDLQEKKVQEEVTEVEVTEVAAAATEVDAAEVASEVAVVEQPAAKKVLRDKKVNPLATMLQEEEEL